MSATTATEGYPYPLTSDFADVQDSFRLAMSVDADLRSEQAPFRAFIGRPSFIARQTANGSSFGSGSDSVISSAIDWDNTGGLALGSFRWTQPVIQQPSWWLFGATVLVAQISGTVVVGDMTMGVLNVNTTDPVTNLISQINYSQRNDDTNTGGEWINLFAMGAIYQGSLTCSLNLNGSSLKAVGSGSRFWGMYLGPVT